MSSPVERIAQAQRLMAQGKTQEALAEARRAVQQDPRSPGLHNAMAMLLMAAGEHEQALFHARRSLEFKPNDPILAVNLGRYLVAMDRKTDAVPWFLVALEGAPGMPQAHQGLIEILRSRSVFASALAPLEQTQARRPDDPILAGLYAACLTNLARVTDSAAFLKQWLSGHEDLLVSMGYASTLTYCPGAEPADVFEAHVRYGKALERSMPPPIASHPNDPDPERTLRVGVLSNELRRHAVATFLEPWLEHHDRARVRITCYPVSPRQDEVTARMKAATEGWVPAAAMKGPELVHRIRTDRVDVLVETTGLNQGHRMGVMWMKPAPVQATMIGYLNTTGIRSIDYRIVDAHTDPPGAEALSVEKLIRLEPSYWCYRPPADAPEPAPRDPGSPITFGSFNSAAKINDRVIDLWAQVLLATPGTRLVLKAFDFADPPLREDMTDRFTRRGVEPAGILIEGPTLGEREFFSVYHRVDIGLDPFPFNGTTTTLDALWMGVPVVALAGRTHAGRTGVSILTTLGAPELLAATEADYARIAIELATDPARLADLRRTLRPRLKASPLCDGPGFARRMDEAVRGMWRAWCAGRPGAGR